MADENSINHILARLSSLEAKAVKIASLEARIEVMDDDIPEPQKRFSSDGGVAIPAEYTSFFKVWATTVGSSVTIGVKDGCTSPSLPSGKCGEVRINNSELYVSAYQDDYDTGNTSYGCYLLCWIDEETGAGAEIIIKNELDSLPAAPTRADPAPTSIVAHGFLYLGRVYVDGAFNVTVNQDYLQGGTAQILLLGECGSDVELYLTDGA